MSVFFTWLEAIASAKYWIHFMVRFDDVHAFGYNCAGSERIWMKFGVLREYCLTDFGRDPRRSNSGRASRNFVFFCPVNNARLYRFSVSQISRNSHTIRGSVSPWILSENICENLPVRGLFCKKVNCCVKILNDFRLQAAISAKWLQIAETLNWRAYRMLAFHLYRWNQLKVIPLACTAHTRRAPCPKNTLLYGVL